MTNNEIIKGFDSEELVIDHLAIRLKKVDSSVLILYLTGHIDTYNSTGFQGKVNMCIKAGFKNLIFHFGGLTYVSSTGIGAFTGFLKAVKPKGGDLAMLEINPKVYEVFQLLGFSQFFKIADSLDVAIKDFSKAEPEVTNEIFPKIFRCPICSKRLRVSKSGRFRCGECKTIIAVDKSGQAFLG